MMMAEKMKNEGVTSDWVASHLEDMGVTSVGDRLKIMHFLEELHPNDFGISHHAPALLDHPLCSRTYCMIKVMSDGHTKTVVRGSGGIMQKFHCEKHDFRVHEPLDTEIHSHWATSPMFEKAETNGCVCVCPDHNSKDKYKDTYDESQFTCSITHHVNCVRQGGATDSSPYKHHITGEGYNLNCAHAHLKTLSHC